MSSSVLGELRIILGGDTSDLDKSLKSAQSSLSSFGSKLALGFAAAAAAATAAGYAVASQVKGAIDTADQLNKLSQSTGRSTEELSKLNYAASVSDVSAETLSGSLGALSKAMGTAVSDGASEAANAFTAMGVAVRNNDGTLRNSSDVLKDVADKFASYKDGSEKANLATLIFGSSGAALIPMLNRGSAGLTELGNEAEKFGLVLDKKTTAAADAFNENLKRMDAIKQGLFTTIAAKLLPAMELYSEQLLQAKSNSDFTNQAAGMIATGIKFVANEAILATTAIGRFGAEIKALWDFGNAPWGQWGEAWAKFRAEGEKSAQVFADMKKGLDAVFSAKPDAIGWGEELLNIRAMQKEVALLGDSWKSTAPVIAAANTAGADAIQKFLNTQAKSTAGHEAEAAAIGKTIGEQERLRVQLQANAIAKANDYTITGALALKIAEAGDAAAAAAMKVAAAQVALQAMTPAQQFAYQMQQLDQLYQNTSMTMETYAQRQMQLAQQFGMTWQQVGSQAMGSFSQLAGAFAKNNKTMGVAAKAFGIAQAIINTQMAITKALATYGPTPMGYTAVAAAVAQGVASVATIASQGFKTGGSFTVGGSGGLDSQFVPIMATPGEQVDIWRPDEAGGDRRRGGGAPTVVNLAVASVTTRDTLREIIDGLNDMVADGYRINVKPA